MDSQAVYFTNLPSSNYSQSSRSESSLSEVNSDDSVSMLVSSDYHDEVIGVDNIDDNNSQSDQNLTINDDNQESPDNNNNVNERQHNNNSEPQRYTFRRSDLPLILRTCVLNLSVRYLKTIPKTFRRYIEVFLGLRAFLSLLILFYSNIMLTTKSGLYPYNSHPPCFTVPENITELMSDGILTLKVVAWKSKSILAAQPVVMEKYEENHVCAPEISYGYRSIDGKYPICHLNENIEINLASQLKTIASLSISRYDGILRLPKEAREKHNIQHVTQSIFENDMCIGNRLQRLILMTSDDYNSFLLKVVENLVDHEKFKVENYDKSVNKQRSKPEKKVKRKVAKSSKKPDWVIKISVLDDVLGRFYYFNAIEDDLMIKIYIKTKALITCIVNLLLLPYIIVTVSKRCYAMLMKSALGLYSFYSHLASLNNEADLWARFRMDIISLSNKIAGTVILVFFALIGTENVLSTLYLEEAIDIIFLIIILELYYSIVIRSDIGRKWFPRFIYVILAFSFYSLSYYSYSSKKLLLSTTHEMVDFTLLFFYHHFELPLIDAMVPLSLPGVTDDQLLGLLLWGTDEERDEENDDVRADNLSRQRSESV